MGKCHVELNITINTGNFSSVRAQVGFEESYGGELVSGTNEEARETKFQELLEVCNDKLDEAVLTAVRKIKVLTKKDS